MNQHPQLSLVLFLAPALLFGQELIHEGLPEGPAVIKEDRQGRLHVAVLGKQGIILRSEKQGLGVWIKGQIAGFDVAPRGDVWLVRDGRIVRYDRRRRAARPVDRTDSFGPISQAGPLFASHLGDIWSAGCRSMCRADGMFLAVPPLAVGRTWTARPTCNDTFGNVWGVATRREDDQRLLVVLTRKRPHGWQTLRLPAEHTSATWWGPLADDVGFVWLATPTAVIRIEPQSDAEGYRVIKSPSAQAITAIAKVAGRQIIVGFSDGAVRELTVQADRTAKWRDVVTFGDGAVRAMLHDRQGKLWAVSGRGLYETDKLRQEWQKHWETQPRMPVGNHDHIFARIGDRLYTAGGKTYFGWPASKWANLDHVWSYSVDDGTWRLEPPMLEPGKAYSGIAALDGELWLIGGLFRDGSGTKPTRTVEIFNPRTRRYRRGPAFKHAFGQVVALTLQGRLYAIGGGNSKMSSKEMVSIGAGETKWKLEPTVPGPIVQASGCVLNGKIYIAGAAASKCPGLFVYDPKERRWTVIKRPTSPPAAPLCTAFAGEVWVLGGRGPGRGLVATHAYSPRTGKWRQGPDLPLPVSWAAAAEVNGRLMVAGGAYEEPHIGNYFNTDRVFLLRGEQKATEAAKR